MFLFKLFISQLVLICFGLFASNVATAQYCSSSGNAGNGHYILETYDPEPGSPFNDQRVTGPGSYTNLTAGGARWTFEHGVQEQIAIVLAHPNTTINYRRYWIDYDQNGVFDASELVVDQTFNPPFNSSTFLSNTLTPPANARSGQTRMRVSVKLGSAPNACESGFEGEVEDYTVTIGPPLLTTSGIDKVSIAPGSGLEVYYSTALGVYGPGNAFSIELSDAAGSFVSPTVIGSIASTTPAGTILCTIPIGQPIGSGYRVRVRASQPSVVADDNGLNIEISNSPVLPTPLSAGDLAFIGANADDAEQFSIVLLKDLGAQTLVTFTDRGWDSSMSSFTNFPSSHGEGTIYWSHDAELSCGTIITFTDTMITVPGGFTASIGQVADDGFGIGTNGDQIFCFTGSASNPNFVAGIHMDYNSSNFDTATNWSMNANGSSRSQLPAGLQNGVNAVSLYDGIFSTEKDNAIYDCPSAPTSGVPADLAASINDNTNWISNSSTRYVLPPLCAFSCQAACPQPMTVFTNQIGLSTARLNWSIVPEALGYLVEGGVLGSPNTVSLTTNGSSTNQFNASGLIPDTKYVWRIKAICAADSSVFSDLDTFETLGCTTPNPTFESNITSTSVTLNWNAMQGAIGYILSGSKQGFSPVTIQVPGQATTSFSVGNLDAGSTYFWNVRTVCQLNPLTQSLPSSTRIFTLPSSSPKSGLDGEFIHEPSIVKMSVYPNPGNGIMDVVFSEEISEGSLSVYNIRGRKVMRKAIQPDHQYRMNLQDLPKGNYLIVYNGLTTSIHQKIVLQ